ncbi:hypothetical protein PIB30_056650 [Stylosanthes scabra]|uniref:Uncharacterized protein n=1 Tax=Stylosanthes scabra TaxID=79078 RepID=A0ABU6TKR4_9FABA|nr:hypothetical protein [Stylosanthes scabra]
MGIEEKRTRRGRERCERRRRFCRHGPASPPLFITTAAAELCLVIVKLQMLWWFEFHRRLSSLPLFPSFTLPTFMEEASSLKNAVEQRKRMRWIVLAPLLVLREWNRNSTKNGRSGTSGVYPVGREVFMRVIMLSLGL